MWSSDWQHWKPHRRFRKPRWKTNIRNAELLPTLFHFSRSNRISYYCRLAIMLFEHFSMLNWNKLHNYVVFGGSGVSKHMENAPTEKSRITFRLRNTTADPWCDSQKNAECIHRKKSNWKISQEITPLRWVCECFLLCSKKVDKYTFVPAIYNLSICNSPDWNWPTLFPLIYITICTIYYFETDSARTKKCGMEFQVVFISTLHRANIRWPRTKAKTPLRNI